MKDGYKTFIQLVEFLIMIVFCVFLFFVILRGSDNVLGISNFINKIYLEGEHNYRESLGRAYEEGFIKDEFEGREWLKSYQEEHLLGYVTSIVIPLAIFVGSILLAFFTTRHLWKAYLRLPFRKPWTGE